MEGLWDAGSICIISDLVSCPNQTNSTNSSTTEGFILSPYYQHSLPTATLFTLAYLFIFLLCLMGNGLVCAIVLRNRRMRTVTNIFILNLAVSDLLIGIFCIPTTLVDNLITGWPFSNTVCKLSGLVQGTSVCASVFTLVAIAVDRFRCIVYPFKPKLTLFVAKVSIGTIWVLALTIMFPSALMLTVEEERNHFLVYSDNHNRTYPLYSCYETWPDPEMRKVYTTVLFVHIYVIPLALIMLMYGRIGGKLYGTTVLSSAEPEIPSQAKCPASQRKIRVIKMLIVVALLFMLSWLPLWTLMLLTDYAHPDELNLELLTSYVFPISHWLAFSNSSVNPIIYGYFNENFKRGFQAACQKHACFGSRRKRRFSVKQPRVGSQGCSPLNTGVSGKPLGLGTRTNQIFAESDLTGCVRLELEHRSASGDDKAEGGSGAVSVKRKSHFQDIEKAGSKIYNAWEL
ncbi:neuropeptide FF receptor 1 like 3 [Pimephales promelas]|uniref:neuropeptide FF receptor 1 like 3 n=1 Tax=Pimephales promelas TaxID=90988 RepID=UPI0019557A4D|nr:neuropeptide FF receptor 1 like 3 [Pimephales promelas]KAG1927560.1 neuropeptide FF receptor [Pimephales promelas]KAG1927561.1 neuropeptide FF receptor [Pimephales promelas]